MSGASVFFLSFGVGTVVSHLLGVIWWYGRFGDMPPAPLWVFSLGLAVAAFGFSFWFR